MLKKYEKIFAEKEELMLPGGRSCPGCGGGILTRTVFKAIGPNAILSSGSCGTNTTGLFPIGAMACYPLPVSLLGGCGGALSGIDCALRAKGKEDATVLGIVGDGDAADIGHGSLSGMFERGHKVIVIVADNEGYAATGGQRSGTTELKARTRSTPEGKSRPPKYLPLIFLAHNIPYVATCSIGYPEDIFEKVLKAKNKENQPAFIHCITPCPTNWYSDASKSVELGRLIVETGMWPLWEYERGTFRITEVKEKRPVEDYLKLQGRFSHVTEKDIEDIKQYITDLGERIRKFAVAYSA